METASFSKLLGGLLFKLLAGLLPAAQPFWTPATLSAAKVPVGVFDGARLERTGRGRYRLTLSDLEDAYRFDAVAFDLPGADGRPVHFLDLRPIERPAAADWPARTRHLAIRVAWQTWTDTYGVRRARLTFSAPKKAWLAAHDPGISLPTDGLQRLLRQALSDKAFDEVASAVRDDPERSTDGARALGG